MTTTKSSPTVPADMRLGLVASNALQSAPVHPLQLYFVGAGLLMTGLALWFHPRKRYDGQVGLVVLLAFGVSAAVLEFFRANQNPRTAIWGLPQLEWAALVLTAATVGVLVIVGRVNRHRSGRSRSA